MGFEDFAEFIDRTVTDLTYPGWYGNFQLGAATALAVLAAIVLILVAWLALVGGNET